MALDADADILGSDKLHRWICYVVFLANAPDQWDRASSNMHSGSSRLANIQITSSQMVASSQSFSGEIEVALNVRGDRGKYRVAVDKQRDARRALAHGALVHMP